MKRDAAHWESLYNNRAAVPDHPEVFARWAVRSAAARRNLRCYLDVPYGTHATEKMDIFPALGRGRALLMFIHGGYWRALDKQDHSFLARSEEHTSELQSRPHLVCRLLLEKKKK